jgi:hypothetical protein
MIHLAVRRAPTGPRLGRPEWGPWLLCRTCTTRAARRGAGPRRSPPVPLIGGKQHRAPTQLAAARLARPHPIRTAVNLAGLAGRPRVGSMRRLDWPGPNTLGRPADGAQIPHTLPVAASPASFSLSTGRARSIGPPPQPFITPIGRSFMHFLLMPTAQQVFTTSCTFLYDSGASSMINLGEATRTEMPCRDNSWSTSL